MGWCVGRLVLNLGRASAECGVCWCVSASSATGAWQDLILLSDVFVGWQVSFSLFELWNFRCCDW